MFSVALKCNILDLSAKMCLEVEVWGIFFQGDCTFDISAKAGTELVFLGLELLSKILDFKYVLSSFFFLNTDLTGRLFLFDRNLNLSQ